LCRRARDGETNENAAGRSRFGARHFRVSILDAVEQGLVERIKRLDAPNPVARRDWLEELRASCPAEDTWREEYLCEPGSAGWAVAAQEEFVHVVMRGGRIRRLCIDATGIGAMLAERLRRAWGTRVEDVQFTSDVKAELVVPLLRTFEQKQVRIPADPDVRTD